MSSKPSKSNYTDRLSAIQRERRRKREAQPAAFSDDVSFVDAVIEVGRSLFGVNWGWPVPPSDEVALRLGEGSPGYALARHRENERQEQRRWVERLLFVHGLIRETPRGHRYVIRAELNEFNAAAPSPPARRRGVERESPGDEQDQNRIFELSFEIEECEAIVATTIPERLAKKTYLDGLRQELACAEARVAARGTVVVVYDSRGR